MPRRKLLLADDSITIQKVVNLTFADEGIEVVAVSDGDSALEMIREDSPDIILADVNMPGLSGYEICAEIKSRDFKDQVPVVLLVGSFEPFDEDEAERVGADGYLTKPFQSISQLVSKVAELLRTESAPEPEFEDTAEMLADGAETRVSEPEMRVSESELPVNEPERLAANSESGFEEPSVPAFSDSFDAFLPRPEPPSIEPPDAFEPEVQDFRDDDEFEMSEAFGDDEGIEEIAPSFEEDVRIEEVSEDFLKTQPLTKSDLQEISVDTDTGDHDEIEDAALEGLVAAPEIEAPFGLQSDDEEETATEDDTPVFRIEETDEFEPQTEFGSEEKSDSANGEIDPVVNIKGWQSDIPEPDFPQPEGASVLDLDEINLLELPPVDKEESEIEEFDRSNYESGPAYGEVSTIDEYVGEAGEVEPDVAMDADTSDGYGIDADSPSETADELPSNELVESITRRVIEALSEKAIREIAWEVVPDMADLIIKKMAEEKMKK